MSLRPLPDLDNVQAMTKLGRLNALKSARQDALSEMQSAFVRMQSPHGNDVLELAVIETAVERIKELIKLQDIVS